MSQFIVYTNPVWEGYCADPFVLRYEGTYYAYSTTSSRGDATIRGREFQLLRSLDLVHWEVLGGALEPAPGFEGAAHWAPEVAFAGGKFWMYYSAALPNGDDSTHRLRVAVAERPEGPFRDTGKLLLPDGGFAIDASPFCDPQDGQWYLFFATDYFENRVGTGLAVVPLADDMVTPQGTPRPVVVASADWHISERNRHLYERDWDAWHTVEGPFVVFKDDLYYCFYSGGAWRNESYGVSYAVAEHPLGPWRDDVSAHGPAVLRGLPNRVIGPGHNSVVLAPDEQTHVCVYHAWNASHTARQLCIDPIEWTSNSPLVIPTRGNGRLPITQVVLNAHDCDMA